MIHEDDLHDVDCPECGSELIEIRQWTDDMALRECVEAVCDCGFSYKESYAFEEIEALTDDELIASDLPIERVHNGKSGEAWNAEVRFSPRLVLRPDDEQQIMTENNNTNRTCEIDNQENETDKTEYEQGVAETIAALLYETHETASQVDVLFAAHDSKRISRRLVQRGCAEYREMVDEFRLTISQSDINDRNKNKIDRIKTERESFIVAYDSTHKTAVEIWSVDETLFAKMPWGELHIGDEANEILKEAVSSERIDVRAVDQSSSDYTKKMK